MSPSTATRSLSRTTAYGIVVRGAGMALSLALTVFLARNLAAKELGAYQGVLSICIILGGLASATTERPSTRRIGAIDGSDPSELPAEVALAHVVAGAVLAVVVAALLVGSLWPTLSEPARATMRIAAMATPGVAILSLRQWIALPLHGVAASLGPEQIGQPVLFMGAAALVAYRSGLGPLEALAIYTLAGWVVWVLSSWRSGLLELLRVGFRRLPTGAAIRARVREGRPFVALAAVGVLPIYATIPIVGALLDLSDAGRLAVALQLTGLVAVPLQIVSLATMPRCAAFHRDGDTEGMGRLVRSASTLSLALGLGLAAALLLGMDAILALLGPSFAATTSLIPILVAGQLINAALGPNGPTLQMIGLERDVLWVEATATTLRFAGVVIAAASGSIVGVAFAITVTSGLRNLLLSFVLHRRTGILTLPQIPHRHVV